METAHEVASVARLLSDPLRVAILQLLGRDQLTVNELSVQLGAPQPRISSHLAILREAGWVRVRSEGRQHRYLLASEAPLQAFEALQAATPGGIEPPPRRKGPRAAIPAELKQARHCYDHLAGVAGVALQGALLDHGWIELVYDRSGKFQPSYRVTDRGRSGFSERGVILPAVKTTRRFAYACPDWTEPGAHIGGALGAAILDRLRDIGLVEPVTGGRTLRMKSDVIGWLTE